MLEMTAADQIRRQGQRSQTRTSAHTAVMRRRRAVSMVAVLIMGAAIRPRPSPVKGFGRYASTIKLDRRIPRRRHHAIAIAVFDDVAEPRERVMKTLHLQFFRHHHV